VDRGGLGGPQVTAVVERKSVQATIDSITGPSDAKPFGGFIAVASDESLDRDGERLYKSEWMTPLPDRITVDVDHGMSVGTTVGSAHPYFVGDQLMIDASFSSLERAQEVRTLVNEKHITTVSVAALVDRSKKSGTPRRELLNVGIVAIPANRNAVITDVKGLAFSSALAAVLNGQDVETAIKSASAFDPSIDVEPVELVQAVHNAAAHMGAVCVVKGVDDYDEYTDDLDDGAADGANKSFQLEALRLRMKALRR
jgi:hypothetical protein